MTAGYGSTSTAGADSTLIAVMAARRPPAAKAR
ncbi:hypothetical protein [Xanthomonas oryzae]|nr:hypothetical protein [Xanthomonas oryzae]